jgi:hypothetical protein
MSGADGRMGSAEERLARLEARMDGVSDNVREMKDDVRAIRDTLSEARGGWKTLLLVGGAAGALGAFAGKFLPFLPLPK